MDSIRRRESVSRSRHASGNRHGRELDQQSHTTAPELQFRVNFADQGSYYVHVRGDAGTSSNSDSDSCYVGIDGATQQYTFDVNPGVWGWRSMVSTSQRREYIVSLYGREDGFRADKIVINPAANAPSGIGPEESAFDGSLQTE